MQIKLATSICGTWGFQPLAEQTTNLNGIALAERNFTQKQQELDTSLILKWHDSTLNNIQSTWNWSTSFSPIYKRTHPRKTQYDLFQQKNFHD